MSSASAPAAEDPVQLDLIETLLVKRLMNHEPPSDPPSDPPDSKLPHHHSLKLRRERKRSKRPRADKRVKAFRDSVAQKLKAAEQAALAIATVRPLRRPLPTAAPKSAAQTPVTPVSSTIKVKQLPPATPAKRNKSASEQNRSAQHFIDAANFVDAHRTEVGDFGSQALHRRDRKKYQEAKLAKLGCRPPKNQKMPIGLLQNRRKREKLHARKQKQRDLATGMLLRTKRR